MGNDSRAIAFIGASTGVGLSALKHTLAAGHQCIALCRVPSKLIAIFPTDTTPNLKIVEGNAHDLASVSKCLKSPDGNLVDAIVSTIGGKPVLSWKVIDDPHVCEKGATILLEAIAHLRRKGVAGNPYVVVQSSMSLSLFHRDYPLVLFPLFHFALSTPRADKRVMEDSVMESDESFTIVRSSLLTNGESIREIHVGIEDPKTGPESAAIGYTISREDTGRWIAENLVLKRDAKYINKIASVTY